MNEYERRKIVIDFISKRPGCIVEDIVREQDIIGRGKVFKIIEDLKKEKVVIEQKSKPNSRNIKLFINLDNRLVTVPREIDEFEQLFIHFINKLVERNSRTINMLTGIIYSRVEELMKEIGKKENENLSLEETEDLMSEVNLYMDLEELSIYISSFVKAMDILNEFIRVNTITSLVHSTQINDKESSNKLLSLIFNRISNIQLHVIEIISPVFRPLFIKSEKLFGITEGLIDLKEILNYYEYFELKTEVAPVINHLSMISKSIEKPKLRLPLDKVGIISPLQVGAETLEEFFNPDEYYKEQERADEPEILPD
jgi:hypothetical protein